MDDVFLHSYCMEEIETIYTVMIPLKISMAGKETVQMPNITIENGRMSKWQMAKSKVSENMRCCQNERKRKKWEVLNVLE